MDDALFRLWKEEKCTLEDCLGKAHNPDDLAKRVLNAQRGLGEDAPKVEDGEPPKAGGGH